MNFTTKDKGGGLRQANLLSYLDRAATDGWTHAFVGTRRSDGRAVVVAASREEVQACVARLDIALPANASDPCDVRGPLTIDEARTLVREN